MAVDLFSLKSFTEGVDLEELALVHLTHGRGHWVLERRVGSQVHGRLDLDAADRDDAVRIIEAVGLAPDAALGDSGAEDRDEAFSIQPGSEETPDETPV